MIILSDTIKQAIREQADQHQQICRVVKNDSLAIFLDEERFKNQLNELRLHVGSLHGKRLLEVGSGYGSLLIYARLREGLDYHGLEPGRKVGGRFNIAQELLADNLVETSRLQEGVGEAMPYPDGSFDIVFSFQVLEHVNNPAQVLAESWRVLKPGGTLYINAPNYRSFYEGHYHIPWIPGISKGLARIYVRLFGKNPAYIGELNFINESWLRKQLEKLVGAKVESDFGMRDWQSRMKNPSYSSFADPALLRLVRWAQKLGLLRLIAGIGQVLRSQDAIRVAVVKII